MKKKRFVLVFMASFLCLCGMAACDFFSERKAKEIPVCNDWIHPDSIAYRILGKRLTDVLINAKTVNVYSLNYKDTVNSDDVEIEPHFVRESLLGTLTRDQATVLKYTLIANGANYHRDSTFIVMSPYCPVIEFEFARKKEIAHVIVSLSNYTWTVKYDGKLQFNYNYASGTFVKRFCDYFFKKEKQERK